MALTRVLGDDQVMVEPPFSEARSLYGATLVHIRPILALTRVLGRRPERDAGGGVHELCGRRRRRHLGLRPEELRWGPQLELLYLTLFSHVTLIHNPLPTLTSHARSARLSISRVRYQAQAARSPAPWRCSSRRPATSPSAWAAPSGGAGFMQCVRSFRALCRNFKIHFTIRIIQDIPIF